VLICPADCAGALFPLDTIDATKEALFLHVQLRVLQMDTPNAFSKARVYPNEPPGGMPEKSRR